MRLLDKIVSRAIFGPSKIRVLIIVVIIIIEVNIYWVLTMCPKLF